MTKFYGPIRYSAMALALTCLLVACGKKEAEAPVPVQAPPPVVLAPPKPAPAAVVTVSSIDLGNAIGADQRVTASSTVFVPVDTIYAAIATSGAAASATLTAKWTFQDGQTVNESTQTIAPTGAAVTTFNIQKPDGWPVGKYKVEITLNGTAAGSKEFEVK